MASSRGWPTLRPARDPDDADEMAETVRLGFESYEAWAPAGCEPPPAGAGGRAHPRAPRRPATRGALSPLHEGAPAGHVTVAPARERGTPRPADPRPGAPVAALRAPAVVGQRPRARGCTRSSSRRRPRAASPRCGCSRPRGQARARAFYEREGWRTDGVRDPRADARASTSSSTGATCEDPAPCSRRRPPSPTLSDRAAPLLEEAAERSRVSMRTRLERLRLAWRSILQVSVAAALAWLIATEVLGHPPPFFAPVSAIITLGLTVGQRGRRAAEVAFGVALGIAIADLLVLQIGTGAAQLAIVVLLATSAAIFLGSGQMLATQAAVSAALVATLQPPTDGFKFDRFLDALVGGGVALLVNALLLPAHPSSWYAAPPRPVLEELAATLEDVAVALERRDRELAEAALRARPRDRRARRPLRRGGRRQPRDHPLRAAAPARARRRRVLRRRRGADRPRGAQRPRARARGDPRAQPRRERPAGDRRRAARPRRGGPRAGGRPRGPGAAPTTSASRPCGRPPRPRSCSSAPATCR